MQEKKYTLGSKVGFGLADIVGGGSFALISLLFLNFLVTAQGISPAIAGIVVMVGKFWDAFIDPFLGMISDRTRSRFGRRRVYFLVGIVPIIGCFTLLWFSFGLQGMIAKAIYFAIIHSLFTISYSIVQVPYNALLPDMVDSYEQRASYSSIRIFISTVSATISVTVPNLILGPEASRTAVSYLTMGLVFGLFYGLPLIAAFFATWENPLRQGVETDNESLKTMFSRMGTSLKNRAYRLYLGIFCFGQMTSDIVTAIAIFWLSDILNRSNMLTLFSGIVMVVGLLILPFNNWIGKKYGKHIPAFYCTPLRIIGLGVAFFMSQTSGMAILIAVCVLNGIGTGSASFVPWSLLPDLPDSDEMITGKRNAGLYAGMSTFIRTATSGIAIFLIGIIMQAFGYAESVTGETVTQSASALFGVRFMFSIVPIMLCLLVTWLALRYTLTKGNHAAVQQAVAHKRETGKPITDPGIIAACEKVTGYKFEDMWVGRTEDGGVL
jgi:oligogalacturonide transporter